MMGFPFIHTTAQDELKQTDTQGYIPIKHDDTTYCVIREM